MLADKVRMSSIAAEGSFLATDEDFSGSTDGTFSYIGSANTVHIPHVIKGVAVTKYNNMFEGASVSSVISDNAKVVSMDSMFLNSKATNLDLSSFDTSSVTSMRYMFSHSKATNLDLSSFDTSSVTMMTAMFFGSSAVSLDLSSFDTSSVSDFGDMFKNSSVLSLDLSSFDTSSATMMTGMFYDIPVTSLDLSTFDTSSVTSMRFMFYASKVDILDLSSFDTNLLYETTSSTGTDRMFWSSISKKGYARTSGDARRFNNSLLKPSQLSFTVK